VPESADASGCPASEAPASTMGGVQYDPFGKTEGSLSQHARVPVTSADGQRPAGHIPALS
jgi:hypothetical protein